ncbi:coiled-coil domain-containing protein-domain-containing protein [Hypoxylon rubiginosum]|uniref:Coiled-coil domain-containing protein-domain-containing protein n=1 Tax=Hypoxylon rubiginosum TaxID=110542 RepID=A0ACC0D9V0_9PEZI|nr:coiled-coil domain-containing protein-domain-containing protein [Hypoxylon rubiginosum]
MSIMTENCDAATAASPMPPEPPPSPPRSSISPSPTSTYVKPQPRPPKSPAHSAQIRVQNRRREYLERNPKYFQSLEHELADPLLYDALIRRFQSPEEREKEGRTKGYSRVLEVDLLRGEAKLAQLTSASSLSSQDTPAAPTAPWLPRSATTDADAFIREYANGTDGLGDDSSNPGASSSGASSVKGLPRQPETREEGRGRWDDFLRRRFVLGRDDDFDYRAVDENDDFDVMERREQEDAWFDDEDPDWASDFVEDQADVEKALREKKLEGETGIQDF